MPLTYQQVRRGRSVTDLYSFLGYPTPGWKPPRGRGPDLAQGLSLRWHGWNGLTGPAELRGHLQQKRSRRCLEDATTNFAGTAFRLL
jgi:hypothetical protein